MTTVIQQDTEGKVFSLNALAVSTEDYRKHQQRIDDIDSLTEENKMKQKEDFLLSLNKKLAEIEDSSSLSEDEKEELKEREINLYDRKVECLDSIPIPTDEEKLQLKEKLIKELFDLSEKNKEYARNMVKTRKNEEARLILRYITTIEHYIRYILQDIIFDKSPSQEKLSFVKKIEDEKVIEKLYETYDFYGYKDLTTPIDEIISPLREQFKQLLDTPF